MKKSIAIAMLSIMLLGMGAMDALAHGRKGGPGQRGGHYGNQQRAIYYDPYYVPRAREPRNRFIQGYYERPYYDRYEYRSKRGYYEPRYYLRVGY